jgi:hypothetical protein
MICTPANKEHLSSNNLRKYVNCISVILPYYIVCGYVLGLRLLLVICITVLVAEGGAIHPQTLSCV